MNKKTLLMQSATFFLIGYVLDAVSTIIFFRDYTIYAIEHEINRYIVNVFLKYGLLGFFADFSVVTCLMEMILGTFISMLVVGRLKIFEETRTDAEVFTFMFSMWLVLYGSLKIIAAFGNSMTYMQIVWGII